MKRAAAIVAIALVAAGCGESRTARDVKADFARHGIRLEGRPRFERAYREALERQARSWKTRLARLAILAPPPDRLDDYVLLTPVPGDRSEDVNLNVVVVPDSAQALESVDLTNVRAAERRGYALLRDRNVVVAYERPIGARLRARIEAALRGD